MNNFKLLTQEQLKDPAIFEKIRQLTENIVWSMLTKEAYNLALNLEKSLEAANLKAIAPKLAQEYESIIVRLKLTALPMLGDEESVKIIKEHFLEGLGPEIDIENRLTAKLFSLPLTPRDDFRPELQRAAQNNQQKIGPLTINQWLSDYNNFSHPDQRTNISPREYLLQSRLVGPLSEENKNKLYTLFHVYDHLLLVTPVMSEEEVSEIIGAPRPPTPAKATPPPPPASHLRPAGQRPIQPAPPSSAYEAQRTIRLREDRYQEPTEEVPSPKQTGPRIEGNVVDLKRQQ